MQLRLEIKRVNTAAIMLIPLAGDSLMQRQHLWRVIAIQHAANSSLLCQVFAYTAFKAVE
eukprot:11994138-Karenia_brevis.AAC.1